MSLTSVNCLGIRTQHVGSLASVQPVTIQYNMNQHDSTRNDASGQVVG